nr:NAD-dependent epimerase/dehydratase family protein [Butyrivibrio sp.]
MTMLKNELYKNDVKRAIENTVGIESLYGKSVMITGATGIIGSFITEMLIYLNREKNANITIYAVSRSADRIRQRFGPDSFIELLQQNVITPFAFSKHIDYIIHAASNAYPKAMIEEPVETIMANIQGTQNLLEMARQCNAKRLLFISSGEVYGKCEPEIEKFREDYAGYIDSMNPRSCYPQSKRMAENLCVCYQKEFGVESAIARLCHTFGPNVTSKDNRATVQFFKNAVNKENIVLKSSGTQLRSYQYIADSASALLTVMINAKPGEAYNIANDDCIITIRGIAEKIAQVAGTKLVIEAPDTEDIAQQTFIEHQVLDSTRLTNLGWKNAFSIDEGIEHTY